ncbi:MAG: glycosyltransferase family 2 protein [Acidocella sp.]|nr:glycosyltransferase family 2 protein [Acidocella sp.]
MSKIACVAIIRNEERHIAEWLAWQFALGFDHVLLLDNLSTDATRAVAEGLGALGGLEILTWPQLGPDYQSLAYEFALRHLRGRFDWAAFFDVDEFLVLAPGVGLKESLSARDDAAAIVVPWAIFGSSGHEDMPDGLVTEQFTLRASNAFEPNRHVKSIVRPERTLGLQSAHNFVVDGHTCFLDGTAPIWAPGRGLLAHDPDYGLCKLHHYFTRSRRHWAQKLSRGYPDIERADNEFDFYDRNDVFDDSAHRLLPSVKTLLAQSGSRRCDVPATFGIAITTFNRRDMVCNLVRAISALTTTPYELVVCDDGGTDGTAQLLADLGVRVISGENRGVAWNKNRGLCYLMHLTSCEVILLLDDDMMPVLPGWEHEWIAAAQRFGHVNYALPAFADRMMAGALTAANPGITSMIPGCALGFARIALSQLGYFDPRFGHYGHEHSDISFRAVRAGFGGVELQSANPATGFFVINGGLELRASQTTGTPEDLARNGALLAALGAAPIYRHAWADDAQMRIFLGEIQAAMPHLMISRQGSNLVTIPPPAPEIAVVPDLVFDIGMAAGDETASCLARGLRVVGVEPDVARFYHLQARFAAEIADGRLIIHQLAAAARHGEIIAFTPGSKQMEGYHVLTTDWQTLVTQHGVPCFALIKPANTGIAMLSTADRNLPDLISVRCLGIELPRRLSECGYRHFNLAAFDDNGALAAPPPPGDDASWLDFAALHAQWVDGAHDIPPTGFYCQARM